MLAEENVDYADAIVKVIEKHLSQVSIVSFARLIFFYYNISGAIPTFFAVIDLSVAMRCNTWSAHLLSTHRLNVSVFYNLNKTNNPCFLSDIGLFEWKLGFCLGFWERRTFIGSWLSEHLHRMESAKHVWFSRTKSTWIVPLQTGEARDEVACPLLGGLHRQEHRSGLHITLHPEHRVNFLRCLWKGIFNPSQLCTHKRKRMKRTQRFTQSGKRFPSSPWNPKIFLENTKSPLFPVIDVFHVLCLVQWVPECKGISLLCQSKKWGKCG